MHAATSAKKQREYVEKLQAEIDALQQKLGDNVKAETIVSNHIKLLHRYNEAKDATQVRVAWILISDPVDIAEDFDRKASLKGTTIRQIHIDMALLDDAN
ncbi:hypothetical protein SCLCIDRAFT_18978 [Scleroderma citrinum Foug A]|uniref:Uncharacterized protein n=1 Tax=Scleroderma citrinum Foug A TaxID=1036808 RepID=A0A0C3AYC7_9AGAM|nr:hypothetical protein SCLCIDRAFT_18978 [Scleroderma citrinum Foug A]